MPQLTTSRVPVGFAEATAPANGITMNYVRGGPDAQNTMATA